MKISLAVSSLLLLLLLAFPTNHVAQAQCSDLIWSDNFAGTKLDDRFWTPMIGDGCDLGICGWGNNEWQTYTDSSDNIEVSGGTLKIRAQYNPETKQYTSARIRSLGKADFDLSKPHRIEARMKLPQGNNMGLWSALWMMPSNMALDTWPTGGEIDIMEHIGKESNYSYGVMHYGHAWNDKNQKGSAVRLLPANQQRFHDFPDDDFHDFAIDKTNKAITWYIDGYRFLKVTADDIEGKYEWPFENVFHLILNLAVGGNWPGYPDDTTEFPSQLEIDYIKVYDLKPAKGIYPRIEGDTLVNHDQKNVRYCIRLGGLQPGDDYQPIDWAVPDDATFRQGNQPNCIRVNFGKTAGYVKAAITFTCGSHYHFQIPVDVQDYYGVDVTLVGPDAYDDQVALVTSTGDYSVREANGNDNPATVVYQRNIEEAYDNIIYETRVIDNPQDYVLAIRKFYLDAFSETAAPCTRFWIQLEDSSKATYDNYPQGRHSRYMALLDKGVVFQRLEFDYYDQPDTTVTKVDRIVILIDAEVERGDTYEFRNFVSAKVGCTTNCQPLSTGICTAPANSEEGACTDGKNNDGVGWHADGMTDCDDSDCWDDPACQGYTPAPTPSPEICNDNIDNDNNGYTDCDDLACADSVHCGSTAACKSDAHPKCNHLDGACCPTPHGVYLDCCNKEERPEQCKVHPKCDALGLTGACCPSIDYNGDEKYLDCCEPQLCSSNPRCSGLGLEDACCPNKEGVFLDCCEDKPQQCHNHHKCDNLGLEGECCPTPTGVYLDCCAPRECEKHPACAQKGLTGNCCATDTGVYLDCCNVDMPLFDGYTDGIYPSTISRANNDGHRQLLRGVN